MPWDNFQTAPALAPWMLLLRDTAHYLLHNPFPHPLFETLGVSTYTTHLDYMHVKYLGTDQYFLGSVLFVLCCRLMGGSREDNALQIWGMVSEFYTANEQLCRCPYKILKLSMFSSGPGGYPKLKGKAAEVRDLAPALLSVWREGMSEEDPMHIAILCALEASCRMEEILRRNKGWKLPPDLAGEFWERS